MREYIDVTGANEDEAIRNGLEQLGMDRDEVSVEVLERAKRGFLGIGAAPAKVRISYGEEEPVVTPPPAAPSEPEVTEAESGEASSKKRRKRRERPERQERQERQEQRNTGEPEHAAEKAAKPEKSPKPAKAEKPSKAENPVEKSPKPETTAEKSPKPEKKRRNEKPAKPPRPAEHPAGDASPRPTESLEPVNDEKAEAIRAFLTGLLQHMETPADIKVYLTEGGRYRVILEGPGMGALIGRRGETLDAIQQLTSYAVNRTGARVRIQLDAEGYREKREASLRHLARKTAAKVVKSRRSFTLEPMNAYERHVIHTALQDFPGVTTYSTGVDPNRRVIVAFDRDGGQ